jgi:hypothetical protein
LGIRKRKITASVKNPPSSQRQPRILRFENRRNSAVFGHETPSAPAGTTLAFTGDRFVQAEKGEVMQAVANDYDSGCVPVERLGLEVIARSASTTDGLYLTDLEASTTVTVRTTFSVYRITRLLGTTILVQGGKSFPETTPAILRGATFGGSVLKVGWIGVGLCMEIRAGDRRVVTSPVREITIGQVGQVGQVG